MIISLHYSTDSSIVINLSAVRQRLAVWSNNMISRRKLIPNCIGSAAAIALLQIVSCNAVDTRKAGQRDSNSAQSESTNQALIQSAESSPRTQLGRRTETIRDIDFKNFVYPWYPSYLKSPNGTRSLQLQNGEFEVMEQSKNPNLSLRLNNVSYVDLDGNGQEQAIVTIGGVAAPNRFVGAIFLYALKNGKAQPLWNRETGDRADGGLRRIALDGQALIIEEYTLIDGGGLCCPKKFVRSYFKLDDQRMKKTKSELKSSEYDYAKFLGFPESLPN